MIVAGIEVLNPKLTDTHNMLTNDKRFVGIPDYKSNILAEYRIPRMTGLYFNSDWQYVGRRPLDDVNQHYTPQYNNFDLGLRYSRKVAGKWATWRITANNVDQCALLVHGKPGQSRGYQHQQLPGIPRLRRG